MLEILSASKEVIKANLNLLAKDYTEKTGRKVCLTCPSDIAYMILSLKHHYKMTNFEFKRNAAQYKNKKGDKTTISNGTMTDEKAIEFLRTNPERIKLFSKYPEGWEELLKKPKMTDEQIEEKLAIQAEIEAAKAAKGQDLSGGGLVEGKEFVEGSGEAGEKDVNEIKVNDAETLSPEEEALKASEQAAEEAAKAALNGSETKTKEDLMKMKLSELREAYPEIKATSIKDFVDKVLNQ
jgi:hypothetical protein